MLRILESKDMGRLLARRDARLHEAEAIVQPILDAVRKTGDKGLIEYAKTFDNFDRKTVRVPLAELKAAADRLRNPGSNPTFLTTFAPPSRRN